MMLYIIIGVFVRIFIRFPKYHERSSMYSNIPQVKITSGVILYLKEPIMSKLSNAIALLVFPQPGHCMRKKELVGQAGRKPARYIICLRRKNVMIASKSGRNTKIVVDSFFRFILNPIVDFNIV